MIVHGKVRWSRAMLVLAGCIIAAGCGDEPAHAAGGEELARGARGEESARAARGDVCALVTREELEEIRGKPMLPGEADDNECIYFGDARGTGGLALHSVTLEAEWRDAHEVMDSWRDGVGFLERTMRQDGPSPLAAEDLRGLGDEAIFVNTGIMDFLIVRKGNAYVKVEAMGPREEAIAIARIAVSRL
jgi:hypothetical protein